MVINLTPEPHSYLDDPIRPMRHEEGGVDYNGTYYPYDYEALMEELSRLHVPVREQIEYLQNCMQAYSIERADLLDNVMRKVHQLQNTYDRMLAVLQRTQELDAQMGGAGRTAERDGGEMRRVSLTAADYQRQGIETFVASADIEVGDVRSLQRKLYEARLMQPMDDCPYGDPLLVVMGVNGHRQQRVCPLVWMGKNNQLHLLIDTLYSQGIVRCEMDRKWEVAAQLFVNGKQMTPYTSKQLANAGLVSVDDERLVLSCIPMHWIKR